MGGCTSKTQVSEPRVTHQAQVYLLPPLDKPSAFVGRSPSRRPSVSAAAAAAGATADSISSPLRLSGRQLILRNPGKVHDVYDMEETCVGQGSYGCVLIGTHRMTKSVRAIKIICKEKTRDHSKLDREIEMMKEMDHPNVIKLFETFEDGRATYLAMEFCKGGELFGTYSGGRDKGDFVAYMQSMSYPAPIGLIVRAFLASQSVYKDFVRLFLPVQLAPYRKLALSAFPVFLVLPVVFLMFPLVLLCRRGKGESTRGRSAQPSKRPGGRSSSPMPKRGAGDKAEAQAERQEGDSVAEAVAATPAAEPKREGEKKED